MKKLSLAISMLVVVAACSTASRIRGPDGSDNYWSIKCGMANKHACFEEAGEKCPDGYTIVESGVGRLLIRCKLPGAHLPPMAKSRRLHQQPLNPTQVLKKAD